MFPSVCQLNLWTCLLLTNIKFEYITEYIYVRHNSGELNDLGTKIWGFFPKTAKFRTPNSIIVFGDFFHLFILQKLNPASVN